ncbi:MAG: hypothetical protein JXJ22_14595 [Bacteroidales bacterium]|nr:hypothetical protein [Bacteroidales bacterium]
MKYFTLIFLILLAIFSSCESEKRIPPKGYLPNSGAATEQLEAAYFWIPQDKLSSPYWKDADFVEVEVTNQSTGNLYDDGFLNMTGTYNGLDDFNKGRNPKVVIKAGYDEENIYILVEWSDTTLNASFKSWLWDGPEDDFKSDTTSGWTSQRNQDNLLFLFEKEGSSDLDVWKWNVATTAPFDQAMNLTLSSNEFTNDSESEFFQRNISGITSRSGPAYEWNGERQEITLENGTKRLLDPSYYLLDDYKMDLIGDVNSGDNVFNNIADCRYCHGPNGNGIADGFTDGGSLNKVFTNKYSREGLVEFIGSTTHEGRGSQYWGRIKNNPEQVDDLVAFLRGIAGVPGNILLTPDNSAEVKAVSNVTVGGIETENSVYKVLFIRKLNTGKSSDVVFSPDQTYKFSIRLSDNDEINFIGATNLELTFNSKEL